MVRFGQIRRSSRFPFFRVLDELVVSGKECACNGCEFLVVSDVDIVLGVCWFLRWLLSAEGNN